MTMHVPTLQFSSCCQLSLVVDLRSISSALPVVDIPERRCDIIITLERFPNGKINLAMCLILQSTHQFKIVYY